MLLFPKGEFPLRTKLRGLIGTVLTLPYVILYFRPPSSGTGITYCAGGIFKMEYFEYVALCGVF